jgi:hypothetical protein
MSMEVASPSGRTSHSDRAPEVVSTLIRLIVTVRSNFREPLLDLLYQYRRREGVFTGIPMRPRRRGRPRKLPGRLRIDYKQIEAWGSPIQPAAIVPLMNGGAGPASRAGTGGPASPTR